MKFVPFIIILVMALTGCESPAKTRPGAELTGKDLPRLDPAMVSAPNRPPMPVKIKNPVYPFELRKQRIQGEVVVEFWVEIDGKVVDARAIKSPHPDLSKAAVEATVQSEYLPGMKDGQPKRVRMQVPIMFAL